MVNELSRRVGKMLLFGCVLSVGLAASAGAVELGERIGPLELTTLDGPGFVMDNYDKRIGTVIAFLSARCPVTDQMAERINYVQEEYRHDDILWVGIGSESGDELSKEFLNKEVKVLVEGLSKKPHRDSAEGRNLPQLVGRTAED